LPDGIVEVSGSIPLGSTIEARWKTSGLRPFWAFHEDMFAWLPGPLAAGQSENEWGIGATRWRPAWRRSACGVAGRARA